MKQVLLSLVLASTTAAGAFAQAQSPKPAPSANQSTEANTSERRAPEPKLANIRLDLTITDQRSGTPPAVKTVTMLIADGALARIRTSGSVLVNGAYRDVVLNVDAFCTIVRDGHIKTNITIEYKPKAADATSEQATVPAINELITVLLEEGKPLTISQSADPVTDRSVKIEAKATVLK